MSARGYSSRPAPPPPPSSLLLQLGGGSSRSLSAEAVGSYYRLNLDAVPEASRAYHQAFYAPRDAGHERKGGCPALQHEAEVSGRPCLMHRPVHQQLMDAVAGGAHKRLLLDGPRGGGKSMALLALVEWARAAGW